jgi:hypothetical protein
MAKKSRNIWVVPQKTGWAVRREGSDRVSRKTDTKKEAENIGRGIARREHGELTVLGKDGKIQNKDSFGHDPCPPKDED